MTVPSNVAHYSVERELGRGAMGVVYLGRDSRLGRSVALKTMPALVHDDPIRRARFEREATTLAAVNHPNIAAIFDIAEAAGALYLILEFVDGPTLRDRISATGGANGSLPLEQALDISRQMAAGVEAAHSAGVVHRDLKPDNVKIRPDGVLKILDFGIARASITQSVPKDMDTADMPTVEIDRSTASTSIGSIMGTPGYMSPEQARGENVGKPSDIWSMGCIIYECLTGTLAFPGSTVADALAATLTAEPQWDMIPARTPRRVVELVRRCLVKDARRRFGNAGEARVEIESAISELRNPQSFGTASFDRASMAVIIAAADEDLNAPAKGNLPDDTNNLFAPPIAPFVGQETAVREILQAFRASRLVTLTGPAGVGATRMALRAASPAREEFARAGGAWLIDAAPVSDREFIDQATLLALGAKRRQDEPTIDALARRIGPLNTLLILDQCAVSPNPVALLAASLIPACPGLRILAINTEAFGIEGESVVPVAPLGCPLPEDAGTDGARGKFEAGKLFMERAAHSGKRIGSEDAAHVARICNKLRGWPFAVELAAAMSGTMDLATLDSALDQRLMLTSVPSPDRLTKLMIEWSYDQLSSVDRGLVHRIAMFSGWCSPRALAAVAGAPDSFPDPASDSITGGPISAAEVKIHDLCIKLAARGLIRLRPSKSGDALGARYRVHEAVRAHARDLMQSAGAAPLGKRLATYSLRLLEQSVPRLVGPGRAGWLARLEQEHAAIISSIDFADEETRTKLRELITAWRSSREF